MFIFLKKNPLATSHETQFELCCVKPADLFLEASDQAPIGLFVSQDNKFEYGYLVQMPRKNEEPQYIICKIRKLDEEAQSIEIERPPFHQVDFFELSLRSDYWERTGSVIQGEEKKALIQKIKQDDRVKVFLQNAAALGKLRELYEEAKQPGFETVNFVSVLYFMSRLGLSDIEEVKTKANDSRYLGFLAAVLSQLEEITLELFQELTKLTSDSLGNISCYIEEFKFSFFSALKNTNGFLLTDKIINAVIALKFSEPFIQRLVKLHKNGIALTDKIVDLMASKSLVAMLVHLSRADIQLTEIIIEALQKDEEAHRLKSARGLLSDAGLSLSDTSFRRLENSKDPVIFAISLIKLHDNGVVLTDIVIYAIARFYAKLKVLDDMKGPEYFPSPLELCSAFIELNKEKLLLDDRRVVDLIADNHFSNKTLFAEFIVKLKKNGIRLTPEIIKVFKDSIRDPSCGVGQDEFLCELSDNLINLKNQGVEAEEVIKAVVEKKSSALVCAFIELNKVDLLEDYKIFNAVVKHRDPDIFVTNLLELYKYWVVVSADKPINVVVASGTDPKTLCSAYKRLSDANIKIEGKVFDVVLKSRNLDGIVDDILKLRETEVELTDETLKAIGSSCDPTHFAANLIALHQAGIKLTDEILKAIWNRCDPACFTDNLIALHGAGVKLTDEILKAAGKSCNPTSFARNLIALHQDGFELTYKIIHAVAAKDASFNVVKTLNLLPASVTQSHPQFSDIVYIMIKASNPEGMAMKLQILCGEQNKRAFFSFAAVPSGSNLVVRYLWSRYSELGGSWRACKAIFDGNPSYDTIVNRLRERDADHFTKGEKRGASTKLLNELNEPYHPGSSSIYLLPESRRFF